MGLKLLVLPTLIGLSLLLAVMFIRPDVMSILEQRAVEATKQEALAKVEGVEKNIRSMVDSLDEKKETETLVKRYYPERMDQERAVDMVNFLAQQSGVIITGLSVTDQDVKKKSAPAATLEEGTAASGEIDILSNTEPVVEPPKSYKIDVAVIGAYEGMRGFLERLYRTDRMRTLNTFTIEEMPPVTGEENESIPDNFLEGSVSLTFQYAPLRKAGNVLHHPLFQSATLDYTEASRLSDFINSPVSDLSVPQTGRSNPFERLP